MKKVFIVPGFTAKPNGGWKSWLMVELNKEDIYACSLPMPTPDKPVKKEWIKEISRIVGSPNKDVFLVGHSLGVPAVLRYLETIKKGSKIGGAVLVSGLIYTLPQSRYRPIDHFVDKPFNFKHIKNVCKKFIVIHGDNDSKVPFEQAKELSKILSCQLIPIHKGGAFKR